MITIAGMLLALLGPAEPTTRVFTLGETRTSTSRGMRAKVPCPVVIVPGLLGGAYGFRRIRAAARTKRASGHHRRHPRRRSIVETTRADYSLTTQSRRLDGPRFTRHPQCNSGATALQQFDHVPARCAPTRPDQSDRRHLMPAPPKKPPRPASAKAVKFSTVIKIFGAKRFWWGR